MTSAHDRYRAARDLLLELRDDRDAAVERFSWPRIEGPFNWAVDWFDVIARDNDRPALWIVEEDGSQERYTFEQMRVRSDKLAAWLRAQGIGKGDAVLLMLGNQVELWDSMLALCKIGAVIAPTTITLGGADIRERLARSGAKGIIVNAGDTPKLQTSAAEHPGLVHISVGAVDTAVDGAGPIWRDLRVAQHAPTATSCDVVTDATDPLLLYFTSGTTSRPKLVMHTQTSYPVGHLSTMYWLGLRPGDVHLAISSPGWAKHAWSCFFAPWIAEATIFAYNFARFDAQALLAEMERAQVSTFCAPQPCGACSSRPTCPVDAAPCARSSAPGSPSTRRSSAMCARTGG